MNRDRLMAIRVRVHNVALEARNVSRIVDSEAFEKAWSSATDEQKTELEAYVASIDKLKVDGWVKRVLMAVDFESTPLKELHAIAKAMNVPYYKTKTKEQLIKEMRP